MSQIHIINPSGRSIKHIFAFDSDFRPLGFTLVPTDVPFPDPISRRGMR